MNSTIKNDRLITEFNDYLQQLLLEPNKLSKKEIKDLCLEYFFWAYGKSYEKPEIKTGILTDPVAYCDCRFQHILEQLVNIINQYTQTNDISTWSHKDYRINPVRDLKLMFPFRTEYLYYRTGCGSLNMKFYKLIYYFDFLGVPIHNEILKSFWQFYKKTLNLYAMGIHHYSSGKKEIHVIQKPDEIFIKDNVTHCIYDNTHFCDGVRVPYWLYRGNKENLDIEKFSKIKNADYRSIFIKKAGLEKFIEKGSVIDSYENYPDNEWWAKSEYQLINMSQILVKEIVRFRVGENVLKYWDYAPFLCMKNQTTGEYHLEGVSPECRDLYDALKMRYKGLNLPSYEIQDIK